MTTSSSVRVLLVNAHDDDYRFLRTTLPCSSWTVTRTSDNNLTEALSRYRPDVVIVDDTGDDRWRFTCEAIARLMPRARRVVASRLADDRLWLDVLDAGVDDLIRKPFEAREVCGVLRDTVREEAAEMEPEMEHSLAAAVA